jgi:hypothetical protein
MQQEISQFFSFIMPQSLGTPDPLSVLGFSLLAPGIGVFTILFLASLTRPRWRGYWDAV